jgi:feruloyl esterase
VLRGNLFARPGAAFGKADLDLVHGSVLAQCDAADGLADGLVNAPRQCGWDPAVLQCKGAKSDTCLAPAQVAALRSAYDGVRAPDGSWAMLPMSRGGEPGWPAFVPTAGQPDATNGGGMVTLAPLLFGNVAVDYATMTPAQVLIARSSPFAKEYEATDSNLSGFFAHGGRLILWHGEDDPGPSPVGTNDYADGVRAAWPERAESQFRQFLLPGVHHCGGGPGAFQVDWLEALDDWVASGTAPEAVTGKRPDGPLVRKHCAWPKVARYKGSGEANDPSNWTCS